MLLHLILFLEHTFDYSLFFFFQNVIAFLKRLYVPKQYYKINLEMVVVECTTHYR